MRLVRSAAGLFLLVVLLLPKGEAFAQDPGVGRHQGGIPVHFQDRELPEIVDALARATGQHFIYGDSLRGRVTITVPGRVSPDQAIELLFAALYLRGFTALRLEDGTLRIVPVLETRSGAPVDEGTLEADSERPITTLIELEHVSAEEALSVLDPYVSRNAVALAHAPTNSLILAGTEAQLVRLITIARVVDRASNENLLIRAIRYRPAQLVADMIDTVFNQTPVKANHVQILVDERTNQVIVQGHPAALAEIRSFIEGIDRPARQEGLVQVVRVLNRDAEEMAALLSSLSSNPSSNSSSNNRAGFISRGSRTGQVASDLSGDLVGRDYHIEVDVPTQSLLIASDAETFEVLSRTIAELDRLPPRVAVEVLIFEVTRPSGFKLGIDYFLAAPEIPLDTATFFVDAPTASGNVKAPSGDSVVFGRYVRSPVAVVLDTPAGPVPIRVDAESVAFQAGERFAETNILLRPHIVGVSGEESEVFAGDNIPVPTAATSTATAADGSAIAQNPLNTTQNIERVDVGTRLRIKPTVGEQGLVRVDIEIEVSQLVESAAGNVREVGPTYAQRNLTATVELRPGVSAVLGSTGAFVTSQAKVGIPYLMNIPFLGWLFSTLEERTRQTDLIAVVEARILRTGDDDMAETIRRRLAFERSISRTSDLNSTGSEPFAVLLDTTRSESKAKTIAEAFAADGFETRITPWNAWGNKMWDIYLTDLASFEEAGSLAHRLSEAGWSPEITVLSSVNELAGD